MKYRKTSPMEGANPVSIENLYRLLQENIMRAKEAFSDARPRIISDNGPPFISKDFKQFILLCGMIHVRTSPYCPQSNGKLERYHRTIKSECIRPAAIETMDEAQRKVAEYIEDYNHEHLRSVIGYVAPVDKLAGLETVIFSERNRKLEEDHEPVEQAARPSSPCRSGKLAIPINACSEGLLATDESV